MKSSSSSSSIHRFINLTSEGSSEPLRVKAPKLRMATTQRGREVALHLYRGIRRAHKRHLPVEMRSLGDAYVKSEFQLHKSVVGEPLNDFFQAWEQYLDQILQTARRKESISAGSLDAVVENTTTTTTNDNIMASSTTTSFGRHLPSELELSNDQREQLEKLKDEASRAGRPGN